MGMMQSIREMFALERPRKDALVARSVPTWMQGRPLPHLDNLRVVADEGYRRNSVACACIGVLATSMYEPPLKVSRERSDGELVEVEPSHPLRLLLNRPNSFDKSRANFVQRWVTHDYCYGNSYVHKIRSARGNVVALDLLRGDRTRVKPGEGGHVLEYVHLVEGGGRPPDLIPAADVIHNVNIPDPLNDYYGLSPLSILQSVGDLDTQGVEFVRSFFYNAGVPAGILKFKTRVSGDERERVKELWREQYAGPGRRRGWVGDLFSQIGSWLGSLGNQHGVAVLDADVEYQKIAADIERLRLAPIFGLTESRICMMFKTPPIIVGALVGLEHSTYNNVEGARKLLWQNALSPLCAGFSDLLTADLAPEFGDDLRIAFDTTAVEALQENQETKRAWSLGLATSSRELWNDGLLKRGQAIQQINEAREVVGLDPFDDIEEAEDGYKSDLVSVPDPFALPALPPGDENGNGNGNGNPKALPAAATNGHAHTDGHGVVRPAHRPERFAVDPSWKALHRVADAADPKLRAAFLRAVADTRLGADRTAIEAALVVGDLDGATAAVKWAEIGEAELLEALPPILQQTAIAAGKASEAVAPVGVGFNVTNPRVLAWAQAHGAELVVEVSDSLRSALRAALTSGVEAGLPPGQTARLLLDAGLGLTERQVNAVTSFRQRQIDDGIGDEKALKNAEKYGRRLLRQRANLIGRTESIAASSQGQRELWVQAREAGTLTETARREWIVTDDDRLDEEICAPMAGEQVGLDEPFTLPDGRRVMTAPAHPGCR